MAKRKSSPDPQAGEADDHHGLVSEQQHHETSGVLRDEASTMQDPGPVEASDNSPSNEPSFQTTTPESSTEATTSQGPAASQISTTSQTTTSTQTLTSNQVTHQNAIRAAALSAYNMNRDTQIDVNARNPMKPRPIVPIKKKSQKYLWGDPQTKRQKREATQGLRSSCVDPPPTQKNPDTDDEDGNGGSGAGTKNVLTWSWAMKSIRESAAKEGR
ncbi:MAG: hypothetical protein L6R42_008767 [Xanthoria sp. 1 TBL-2021]|nr:MAG: hypothetical protein L6R42_008767 [Xanthoria sp. 1 TBL-2021]